jgi:hypothetical protein
LTGRLVALAVGVAAIAAGAWFVLAPRDDRSVVKARLVAFSEAVNGGTVDGLGLAARSAQLAAFFADDVEIDLGKAAAPIKGRDTVMGMAERLQPRTAAFRLEFEDISVELAPDGETADVHLTAEFIRRSLATGDESLDAQEFRIVMRRVGSDWQIGRVTAVDTLR